jgi:hypothetical protein
VKSPPRRDLDPDAIAELAADTVEQRYVFVEAGRRAAESVRTARAMGAYASCDGPALCAQVTADLQCSTGDAHLGLRWSLQARPVGSTSLWDDPAFLADYWVTSALNNHGIARAERLPGNVGLLQIHDLDEPEGTGEAVVAAMSFLQRTSALVLDVRTGNGGAPTGVAFLISFFVDDEPVHLLDICDRGGALRQQTWTSGYLPVPRYRDPLFVLTSSGTFSALEELAYDLQAMGRATVVGERTRGAANPVALIQVHPQIAVRVPTQSVRNALTGGNWEGVGVQPDVPCEADEALSRAHRRAAKLIMQQLGETPPDTHAGLLTDLRRILDEPEKGD